MRLLVIGIVLLGSRAGTLPAQVREFPYEAIVDADDTEVRSGPGRKYYATSQLSRGSRVRVHRHDPGGWYMISPPAGSFSWIRAEYVQRQAGRRGVLTANNVLVHVGSSFDDSRDVWQRRLSTGDEVQILDETTLRTPQGRVAMFKIKPPQGEYRWVAGQSITPANEIARRQKDRDPFAVPSHVKRSQDRTASVGKRSGAAAKGKKNGDGQQSQPRSTDSAAPQRKKPSDLQTDLARLGQLDAQFGEIIRATTDQWDFTSLEQGYRQLQEQTTRPSVIRQLESRFAALARYQKTKAEYDDLTRLMSETDSRDAELLALQRQGRQTFKPPQMVVPGNRAGSGVPQGPALPSVQLGSPVGPSPAVPPQTQARSRRPPRFDGAGIIQRAATTFPGAPRHVLLTPKGRILAYLQGVPSVNLDQFLGQSMGLVGRRWFRRDLQSDFMIVHGVTPVRLRE